MTVNYKLDAVNELRKFIWDKMLEASIFDENNYYSDTIMDFIVPIIPVQEIPEMDQFFSGKKFIVYDKTGMTYEDDIWMICNEEVMFTLYATNISDINEMRNFFVDVFRRMDESAKDVNLYTGPSSKFIFHSIYISDISATEPSEEIAGFLSSDVILEVKYSRLTSGNGRYI